MALVQSRRWDIFQNYSKGTGPLCSMVHFEWVYRGIFTCMHAQPVKYCFSLLGRYTWVTGKEPLTYYDMNLSAQDHQTFFTGDTQQLRPEDAGKLLLLLLWINYSCYSLTITNVLTNQGQSSKHSFGVIFDRVKAKWRHLALQSVLML